MIFRYSSIQSYLECPKNWYDQYVLNKINTEQSAALHFGTALHLGIRSILDQEDGELAFNMYWNSIKNIPMKYFNQGWTELKDLACDSFLPNFKSRHAKKFTEFEQEIFMEMPFLGGTLQGTSDFIGLYEGKFTISDWKTSSRSYKKNKIELNPQLYIYSKLYQNKTGRLPEQIMYKVFNKKDGSINTIKKDLTSKDLDAIFNQVTSIVRQMIQTIETKQLWHGADCYCERN